jgi:hypothetical protein
MAIEHDAISDGERHEPKGISSAAVGSVYVATGSATGAWKPADSHIAAYVAFDSATPAYSHSTTTSDTVINPTFSIASAKNFTGTSSPNARLIYTGTADVFASLALTMSLGQASGGKKEIEAVIYVNGVELAGTRTITTTATGDWHTATLTSIVPLSTDDYIEVFFKTDSAHTTEMAGALMAINCFPG